MRSRAFLLLATLLMLARPGAAQYYQTDFPPEEFRERWEKVFEKIGNNAIAVLQGMPMTDGFIFPRQYNNFYYVSGIETPGAYVLLDGRTKMVTLYLPPRNAALEQAEGRILSAADVDPVKRLPGVLVRAHVGSEWNVGTASAAACAIEGARSRQDATRTAARIHRWNVPRAGRVNASA